jgi:predicted RNA-binding Zn ribbon-like protein
VLEFLATLAGRLGDPLERLAEPDDLSRWLESSGVAGGATCDRSLLTAARELREAIYRIVDAVRRAEAPRADDLALLNEWARRPAPSPQLDSQLRMTISCSDPCRAGLAQLARAAIELVAGQDLERIRNCANPTCSLMFVDRSRPGRRRWCSMDRCGNRAKTARYRESRRRRR